MQPHIPHPVQIPFPKEEIAARFTQFRPPATIDSLWQFQLLVERSHRVGPTSQQPTPGNALASLALLNRPNPSCDLEILGQHIQAEIDPANWLTIWLQSQKITPISSKQLPTLAGRIGDVVGSWVAGSQQFLGRFFAMKSGPRLALLCFRAAADYPHIADDIFLSIATFSFVDDSPGPLAEKVNIITQQTPIPWRTFVPMSWEVTPERGHPHVASFQAGLKEQGSLLGKLSFAVVRADQATTHEEAFAKAVQAVRDAGVTVDPGELHCRVMRHPKVWAVAAVVTVDPIASPLGWMRSVRLLDIVTSTLELTGTG